jgi:hypothetical protein
LRSHKIQKQNIYRLPPQPICILEDKSFPAGALVAKFDALAAEIVLDPKLRVKKEVSCAGQDANDHRINVSYVAIDLASQQ